MEGQGEALAGLRRPVDRGCESRQPLRPLLRVGFELEAVLPDVADSVDTDHAGGVVAWSAAETPHEPVPLDETPEEPRVASGTGILRPAEDDRRERPVDVEGSPPPAAARRVGPGGRNPRS